MLRNILFILFVLYSSGLYSQADCNSLNFQKTMGGGLYDNAADIRQTAFNEYIIAGTSDIGAQSSDHDALLIKLDRHGNRIWQKNFGGNGADSFSKVIIIKDKQYIAFGSSFSYHASGAMLAVKTDTAGNVIWSREYFFSGTLLTGFINVASAFELPDGRIAFAANISAINNEAESVFTAVNNIIGILNSDGTVSWIKRIKPYYWIQGGSISGMIADNNTFILTISGLFTGMMQINQSDGTLVGLQRQYIDINPFVGLAKNGNEIIAVSQDMRCTFNRNIELIKSRRSANPFGETFDVSGLSEDGMIMYGISSVMSTNQQPSLMKLNQQGQVVWQYKFPSGLFSRFSGSSPTMDNGSIAVGSTIKISGDPMAAGDTTGIYILKTDAMLLKGACFASPAAGIGMEEDFSPELMELYVQFHPVSVQVSSVTIQSNDVLLHEQFLCKGDCDTSAITGPDPVCQPKDTSMLGNDTSLCPGMNFKFTAAEGLVRYLWNTGDTVSSIQVNKPGTYWISAWNANNCLLKDTITVHSILNGPSGFLPDTVHTCTGSPVKLQANKNYNHYYWSDQSDLPFMMTSAAGDYWLEVTDDRGCTGRDTVKVVAIDCNKSVYFPNAFLPGKGVGNNRIFKPSVTGTLDQFHMIIYNRYGQKVFESNDAQKGWNGIFKGLMQDTNTFIWYCNYRFAGVNQTSITQRGTVTLLD